jgi:signal transduction histidine kinase
LHDLTKIRAQRREHENFAGVVAHDLKAPLTGVVSWAEILEEQLDEAGIPDHHFLFASVRRISGCMDRMSDLISDLLAFTQTQNAELARQPVSLDEMGDQVARTLRDTHHEETPVLEHALLGPVLADPTLVRQLLTNLIGNAVKYVAPGVVRTSSSAPPRWATCSRSGHRQRDRLTTRADPPPRRTGSETAVSRPRGPNSIAVAAPICALLVNASPAGLSL